MTHLSHEDFVLAYYDEPDAGTQREHLAVCAECRAELGRLAAVLDRVTPAAEPELDAGYEARVWDRVSWRLRSEKRRPASLGKLLAAAAVVALAFVGGLLWSRRAPVEAPAVVASGTSTETPQEPARDRVLLLVVGEHFDESERVLVELANLSAEDGIDIRSERERAEALLASNRLYRRTASDRGEEGVATLLDELEPVLLEIARAPEEISAGDLRSIQKRLEARGLVFKIRVARADARAAAEPNFNQNI